jgi:hypothetical protein
VLSELCAIAETGVAIGLSLSGTNQGKALRIALETEIGGANPFSCVQARSTFSSHRSERR